MRFSLLLVLLATLSLAIAQDVTSTETSTDGISGDQEIPSLLLEAAGNGDIDGLSSALQSEDLRTSNVNGWSAAMFAVAGGHIDALRALLEAGVDVNQATNDGVTPLMLASLQVQ